MAEYKTYDSHDNYTIHNARLTKDAEVKDGERGPMVRLTFVSSSRAESDSDLWIEATVADRQADLAAHLKKGDTLGVSGKPCLRRWGDDNAKFAFNLRRAEIFPSIELFQAAKERGFTPGAKTAAKPVPKKPLPAKKPARQIVDIDEDLPGDEV